MPVLLNVIPFPETARFEKVIGEAGQMLYIRDNYRKQTYIIRGTEQTIKELASWPDENLSNWISRELIKRELKKNS